MCTATDLRYCRVAGRPHALKLIMNGTNSLDRICADNRYAALDTLRRECNSDVVVCTERRTSGEVTCLDAVR
jgi:hypothetical protein